MYKVQIILKSINTSLEQETLNFGIAEGGTILSLFTKKMTQLLKIIFSLEDGIMKLEYLGQVVVRLNPLLDMIQI